MAGLTINTNTDNFDDIYAQEECAVARLAMNLKMIHISCLGSFFPLKINGGRAALHYHILLLCKLCVSMLKLCRVWLFFPVLLYIVHVIS